MDANGMPSKEEMLFLQKAGHTFHCAMRILCGDGECECNKQDVIPGGISRKMYQGVCLVCLEKEGHKEWCRNNKATYPEHNTDSPNCWCDPAVEHYDGGDVIVHNDKQ